MTATTHKLSLAITFLVLYLPSQATAQELYMRLTQLALSVDWAGNEFSWEASLSIVEPEKCKFSWEAPLDLDNPAHLDALKRAYERFPEIGGRSSP